MDKDIFDENDRNIRVFGLETQKKIFESKVLLINLSPMITEVGKNLLLSGCKLILFDDNSVITDYDVKNNFFINKKYLGKNKSETIKSKLKEIKSSGIIEILKKIDDSHAKICCFDISNYNYNSIEQILLKKKTVIYYLKTNLNNGGFTNNLFDKKIEEEKIKYEEISLSSDDEEKKPQKKPIEIDIEETNEQKKDIHIDLENDFYYLSLTDKITKLKEIRTKTITKQFAKNFINNALKFIDNETNEVNSDFNNLIQNILGGVVCHEIINLIGMKEKLRNNYYYYDFEIGLGKFLNEIYSP